jgi:hypothetical protein
VPCLDTHHQIDAFYVLCNSVQTKRGRPQTNKQSIATAMASHRRRSQTPVSPMTRDNNVDHEQQISKPIDQAPKSTSTIVSHISMSRTTQAFEHDHTKFVCKALWVWKPMQIHQGRCNVMGTNVSQFFFHAQQQMEVSSDIM